MSAKVIKKDAPKVDAALTIWEAIEDTSPAGLSAIGLAVVVADTALEEGPQAYASRCRDIAAAVLYGPRGTQAAIAKGIQEGTAGTLAAAKKAAERYAKAGRILIAQPDQDPMKVRTFIRSATDEQIIKAIESGALVVAPKVTPKKDPAKRGAGKAGAATRTLRQQVEAASKENAKVLTMAKTPDALPVEDLELFAKSLRATLAAAENMLKVGSAAKVKTA
jgi:hypothetical protein